MSSAAAPLRRAPSLLALCNPVAVVRDSWRYRELILTLSTSEATSRYRGSLFGILWSFTIPLVMIAAYTFVFSGIFKASWRSGAGGESPLEFGVALYCGLIFFNIFSEVLAQAPSLIARNPNYVKRVRFPLQILPIVALNATLFHASIGFGVLLCAIVTLQGGIPLTVLYLPLILAPLMMLTLGLAWLVASLSVYVRDVAQLIQLVLQLLFFTTPLFYPLSAVPEPARTVLGLSPLAIVVESAREVLLWGRAPDFASLGVTFVVAFIAMSLGYAFFMKTKQGFADVL